LLDACGGNEAIETALCVANFLDDLVERGDVADVDLAIVERSVEVFLRAGGDCVEVGRRLGETV